MEEKYIITNELLNKLAEQILITLSKSFTTGYHENGLGRWIDCKIDFRYLSNCGGNYIENLNINFNEIEFLSKSTLHEINEECKYLGYIPVDDRVENKDKPFKWDFYTYNLFRNWVKKNHSNLE